MSDHHSFMPGGCFPPPNHHIPQIDNHPPIHFPPPIHHDHQHPPIHHDPHPPIHGTVTNDHHQPIHHDHHDDILVGPPQNIHVHNHHDDIHGNGQIYAT